MNNEFALQKFSQDNRNNADKSLNNRIMEIANDSLFYFGIFLLISFLLKYFSVSVGIMNEFNIGINEVAVCAIGFVNVFFVKSFKKLLNK